MLGPEFWKSFFQIRFHVLHIIFLNFIWERMNIFFSFAPIQVLIDFSGFNSFAHISTVSSARSSWPRGRYPTGRICSNVFSILGITSDVMNDYSTRRVQKRKYLWYFNSHFSFFYFIIYFFLLPSFNQNNIILLVLHHPLLLYSISPSHPFTSSSSISPQSFLHPLAPCSPPSFLHLPLPFPSHPSPSPHVQKEK